MSHLFFKLYCGLNRLLQLSFDDSNQEEKFQKEDLKDNIKQNKFASIIALIGYTAFIPLSYFIVPDDFLLIFIVFISIPIPALIVLYFTIEKERSHQTRLFQLFLYGLMVCLIPLLFFYLTEDYHHIYLNNFILPVIGVLVMYGVPFTIGILITFISLIILFILGVAFDVGDQITLYSVFVIVFIILIGIVSGYMIEISKRYKYLSQYALEDLNENLEKMIKEEVRKSKEKDKQLYQASKMAAMGEMIGNIAHQWRQPLNIISTAATGMQLHKEYGILSDADFEKHCMTINENAQYLSRTIDDFNNFIEEKDLSIKQFDIEENIKQFLDLVQDKSNDDIDIVKNIESNITLESYPGELIQCFINIFNNSVEALEKQDNGSKFFFIDVFLKDEKTITISLKDNAGGISDDIIAKVFEPYFTTKHQSMGTGLGLYIVYNFISKSMNGNISVQNTEFNYNGIDCKGVEFIIELPHKNN